MRAVFDNNNNFIGLGEINEDGSFTIRRLFNNPSLFMMAPAMYPNPPYQPAPGFQCTGMNGQPHNFVHQPMPNFNSTTRMPDITPVNSEKHFSDPMRDFDTNDALALQSDFDDADDLFKECDDVSDYTVDDGIIMLGKLRRSKSILESWRTDLEKSRPVGDQFQSEKEMRILIFDWKDRCVTYINKIDETINRLEDRVVQQCIEYDEEEE